MIHLVYYPHDFYGHDILWIQGSDAFRHFFMSVGFLIKNELRVC
jgi:hypothetical protein